MILAMIPLLLSVLFLTGCAKDDLILTSTSPNEKYTVEAYLSDQGALGDYAIKVYLLNNGNFLNNGRKKLIYIKYHDYDAKIEWISDEIISINDITLDISKGETYDWRTELHQDTTEQYSTDERVGTI